MPDLASPTTEARRVEHQLVDARWATRPPHARLPIDDALRRADQHLLAGDWRAAVPELDAAQNGCPDDPVVDLACVHALMLAGRHGLAVEQLRLMLAARPADLVVRFYLAHALRRHAERECGGVISTPEQATLCATIAEEIAVLRLDPELTGDAVRRLGAAAADATRLTWRRGRSAGLYVALWLVFSVLPLIVGLRSGSALLVVAGALGGAAVLHGYVLRHRVPRWSVGVTSMTGRPSRVTRRLAGVTGRRAGRRPDLGFAATILPRRPDTPRARPRDDSGEFPF